ncbi:DUF4260 family protein [Nocardia sp. SYP-A9097]|uniref:DUF4260 family protein n=1 Tax=Nocardia sp. SYP-A9097 TaxID=2663237 RepID=UPI00129ABE14|nr:DUF4260 family protein [Nocardia sp. SYP-A9097]MRH92370.1 DUF4260 family protein [Nocardia sp. SYP-A9097]
MKQTIELQRIESFAIFVLALWVYAVHDFNLWLFPVGLALLDIFMIGYSFGPRAGAFVYNLGYMHLVPAMTALAYVITGHHILLGLSCIWFAHNGLARALGFGLKGKTFEETHLGLVGNHRREMLREAGHR